MTSNTSQPPHVETKVMRLRYTGEEAFVAESASGHAIVTSFSHDQMSAPSPMELLLIALGGCTGADVISILEKKRQRVTAYEIEVRGTRRDEHPRIYTDIEVVHRVRGGQIDERAVARAIELSETKYCSVSAMLAATAKVTSRYEISGDDAESDD
ncbi:MAG TPA: OsmC family protein [Blastocatellia bacterium]|nr:OsmC family protein [Blastocatellia bacterium]